MVSLQMVLMPSQEDKGDDDNNDSDINDVNKQFVECTNENINDDSK